MRRAGLEMDKTGLVLLVITATRVYAPTPIPAPATSRPPTPHAAKRVAGGKSSSHSGDADLANRTLSMFKALGVEVPESSCAPGTRWDDESLRRELLYALERIRRAPLVSMPFPHLRVEPLFSDCLYRDLLHELPAMTAYTQQAYPGTYPAMNGVWLNATRARQSDRPVSIPGDCCTAAAAGVANSKCICYYKNWQLHDSAYTTGWALPWARMKRSTRSGCRRSGWCTRGTSPAYWSTGSRATTPFPRGSRSTCAPRTRRAPSRTRRRCASSRSSIPSRRILTGGRPGLTRGPHSPLNVCTLLTVACVHCVAVQVGEDCHVAVLPPIRPRARNARHGHILLPRRGRPVASNGG